MIGYPETALKSGGKKGTRGREDCLGPPRLHFIGSKVSHCHSSSCVMISLLEHVD